MKAKWCVDADWTDGSVWDLKLGADELGYVLRTDDGRHVGVQWRKGMLALRRNDFVSLRAAGTWLERECCVEVER